VDALDAVGVHGRLWDPNVQVPWYTYHSSTYGTHVQGYYDDAASLRAKYAMVKANGMRGVGIWHLLMDVDRPELWDELKRNFDDLPYSDVAWSPFLVDIIWLTDAGITLGCGGGRFCPGAAVTREQMASFLARSLNLQPSPRDYFTDDTGTLHEGDINALAHAGITFGCTPTTFCRDRVVTREQMASFLARGFALDATTQDFFNDDTGSQHEADINAVASAGITSGCGGGRYCPAASVTREQMAAFLHRAALGG
jgi:S-layer homology domain